MSRSPQRPTEIKDPSRPGHCPSDKARLPPGCGWLPGQGAGTAWIRAPTACPRPAGRGDRDVQSPNSQLAPAHPAGPVSVLPEASVLADTRPGCSGWLTAVGLVLFRIVFQNKVHNKHPTIKNGQRTCISIFPPGRAHEWPASRREAHSVTGQSATGRDPHPPGRAPQEGREQQTLTRAGEGGWGRGTVRLLWGTARGTPEIEHTRPRGPTADRPTRTERGGSQGCGHPIFTAA